MKGQDFSAMLRGYENKWVALSHDKSKVVAADKAFAKALQKAAERGERRPVMLKVLSATSNYVLETRSR
jgi:hypothetical protein